MKFPEFVNGVATDAEHRSVQSIQFFFGVTELVRLAGSTRSIRFGEEIEDERLALEIL
jgi:hypothetical protein